MEDVIAIIDELEEVLLSKKKGFFSGKVYVDQDRVSEILAQLRESVPQSYYDAVSILKQRDELISDAERKADAIIRNANAAKEKMINESEIVAQAQAQAENLVRSTREYCEQLKYSVNQELDGQLYEAAVRLSDSLMFIEDVRDKMRKRGGKEER